jgi:Ner family transcriptional regulator
MNTHIQPKKASSDWHRADIKAALEKAGWTLRKLSQHHGYFPTMANNALERPYPNAERIIAEAIGVDPWVIWPSRYDTDHQPIRKRNFPTVRPKHWARPGSRPKSQDNRPNKLGNVNHSGED